MNQIVRFRAFSPKMSAFSKPTRCDLAMLSGVVLTAMRPLLDRRGQSVSIEQPSRTVAVRGDLGLVSSLLSAVIFEAAGLSSANAGLRIAFDVDEGDAVVTIVGSNHHRFTLGEAALDAEMADLVQQAGAELDLLWDEEEGPTLVLRFPAMQALG